MLKCARGKENATFCSAANNAVTNGLFRSAETCSFFALPLAEQLKTVLLPERNCIALAVLRLQSHLLHRNCVSRGGQVSRVAANYGPKGLRPVLRNFSRFLRDIFNNLISTRKTIVSAFRKKLRLL